MNFSRLLSPHAFRAVLWHGNDFNSFANETKEEMKTIKEDHQHHNFLTSKQSSRERESEVEEEVMIIRKVFN